MMPTLLPTVPDYADAQFLQAIRQYHLGQYREALTTLTYSHLAKEEEAWIWLSGRLRVALGQPCLGGGTTLVWQTSPQLWEADWLRLLLKPAYLAEVFDGDWTFAAKTMIVVDNRLTLAKADYYRRSFAAGSRICLIHISDELFDDDLSAYRWCEVVYRNYWSPMLAGFRPVNAFGLGYKLGFAQDKAVRAATERAHLWSFAGDPNKSTRSMMLSAMRQCGSGKEHLTDGFHAPNNLGTVTYRELLDDSIFIPCPAGNGNLDSFRFYEALEAGCIPIVERRAGFDYFTMLLGPHPIPTIEHWNEAPAIIAELLRNDGVEELRDVCYRWWTNYKVVLRDSMCSTISRCFA